MDKLDQLHRFSRKLTHCLNDLVTKAMLLSTEVTDADEEFLQREINLPKFTEETGRLLRQAQQDLLRKHGETVGVNYRPCDRPFSLSFFGSWHERAYITIAEIGDLREESEALLAKHLRRWVELERDFLPARKSSRGRNAKLNSDGSTTEELLTHAKKVCLNLVMQPMEIATKTRSPLSHFEKSNIEVLRRFDAAVSDFNQLEATTLELLNYCGLDAYCGESSISHRRCLGAIDAVWLPFVAATECDYAEPWQESTVNVWGTLPERQRERVTEAFTHVRWIEPDDFKRMKLEFDAAIHNERYRLDGAKSEFQGERASEDDSEKGSDTLEFDWITGKHRNEGKAKGEILTTKYLETEYDLKQWWLSRNSPKGDRVKTGRMEAHSWNAVKDHANVRAALEKKKQEKTCDSHG